jgi:hypothetical protein
MGPDGYDGTIDDLAARVEVLERDVGIMRGILWNSAGAAQATPTQAQPERRTPPRTWAPPQEPQGSPPWGTRPLACSLMYHRSRDTILEAVT